ncbi:RNA polymerase sigma factor [Patulibacter americanus]|uniref:RNA polymerase sigma factor n=1 Tax=Patulibacter americanus TaxID=588672 RepID=UPI0003B51EC3|nr:sigma-70 family RNA polymerase sigma factor [Patulibacter americanus]
MPASAPPRPPTTAGRLAGRAPEATATDAVLVRLAAGGDVTAFEALFRRHRPAVHAQAVRMLQDHGRAEDVVQDVFVSAMRALQEGREPLHPAAWLREITRRACIDQWRAATRRGEVSLDAPGDLSSGDARRLADDDSLARATEDRESVATLRRAFRDLPALQHTVLVQRELEGRAPDEIATRLGLSRTVVEGQLARGRRTLARAYRELQSGERCTAVRALCDASMERALGVRERGRITGHLSSCDGCRRHARTLGVDTRLLHPTTLAAKATLLLPLPLLRRWPVEPVLAGEAAGGALGAKVLVGAAVLAAGSGGVYATRDAPVRHILPSAAPAPRPHPAGASATPGTDLLLTLSGQIVARVPGAAAGTPAGVPALPWSPQGRPAGAAAGVAVPPAAGGAGVPGSGSPATASRPPAAPAASPALPAPTPATPSTDRSGAPPPTAEGPRTDGGRGDAPRTDGAPRSEDGPRGEGGTDAPPHGDGGRDGAVTGEGPMAPTAPAAPVLPSTPGGERQAPGPDGGGPGEPVSGVLAPEPPAPAFAPPAAPPPSGSEGGSPESVGPRSPVDVGLLASPEPDAPAPVDGASPAGVTRGS